MKMKIKTHLYLSAVGMDVKSIEKSGITPGFLPKIKFFVNKGDIDKEKNTLRFIITAP